MNWKTIYKWFTSSRMSFLLACVLFGSVLFFQSAGEADIEYLRFGINLLLGIGTALFLQRLNYQYVIFKSKTVLPAFFYLLLLSSDIERVDTDSLLMGFLFTVCLFFLFWTYQDSFSQGRIFNISLLLGIGSLFYSQFPLILPLIWIGMWRVQSLNIKTLLASLLGILVVYLGLFTWSVYQNDFELFLDRLPNWNAFGEIELFTLSLYEYILYGYMLFLFIVAGSNLLVVSKSDKVRTKVFLEYLLFAGLVLFILLALFIYREGEWTVLFFVPLSYLCAHFFMSHRGKKVIIFFFLTWLVLLASAGLHFFDPFSELL